MTCSFKYTDIMPLQKNPQTTEAVEPFSPKKRNHIFSNTVVIPDQYSGCRDIPQNSIHGILIAKISIPEEVNLFLVISHLSMVVAAEIE